MRLPNFLLIGAAKAGTSAFYRYLEQHPQTYGGPIKEPHFFGLEGEDALIKGSLKDGEWKDNSIRNFDDYCSLFKDAPLDACIFEASTSYLYLPKAPQRIKHYLPEARIIAVLRNPVDRAYSSFLYLMRDGREPLEDFELALEAEAERIQANWDWLYRYKDVGYYSVQLERYFDEFPQQQLKIIIYDDLVSNPSGVLRETFDFIGIDSSFQPDTSKRFNVSGVPNNKAVHTLVNEKNPLKSGLKLLLPKQARASLKNFYYGKNLSKPSISDDLRAKLSQIFYQDILKTQDLLNRDLSGWLHIK